MQAKHGREQTEILNDGETLQMSVRGVIFSGSDFDGLSVPPEAAPELLASFVLHHGDLCGFTLRWTMPLCLTFGIRRQDSCRRRSCVRNSVAGAGALVIADSWAPGISSPAHGLLRRASLLHLRRWP